MIDLEEEDSGAVNPWIGFADLFAGLVLVSLMGLLIVSNELRLSYSLTRATARAAETTARLQAKLGSLLEGTPQPKTQTVIPEAVLFNPGAFDDFRNDPQKKELLLEIGRALQEAVDEASSDSTEAHRKFLRIIIEGHTDSDELKGRHGVETNWELSSRRATGVLRFFYENGLFGGTNATDSTEKTYNIVATGLADTVPVDTNLTEDGKRRNRRIVIRIEPDIESLRAAVEQGRAR